ncbi:MAG TPA: tetratricopeptide repeat protein [Actinomycetota bacterium]|nr:tetratricopeptide repeat protein [Actinomycetota bacterium]
MPEATCSRCGAALPADARFCPNCGTPTPLEGGEERKIVTVLFADLAGSTSLASHLDPERFREILSAFYELATNELASLRGRAEKFVGDAVMALFGIPLAHEDDALRAVRAGFRIREGTARLGKSLGLSEVLDVRVGVNSGPVAAGPGASGEPLVSGAVVNLAARLQQAAEPGEILVGETTWQLTRDAVEFGPEKHIDAKGFDGVVSTRSVLSLSPRSTRRTIPLVGRKRELDLLTKTYTRVRETSRAHLFTLLGEAGIGKTRLADELVASLPEETSALVGRSGEYEEDPTFAPVADMVRQALSLEGDDDHDVLRRRVSDLAGDHRDASEVDRVANQLGLALGLGSEAPEERRYRMAEIRAGFLTLLEDIGRQGPVVLVWEDLQSARPELMDLIYEVARGGRRIPLLLLCLARDTLLETRPEWGGGLTEATTLRLEPLTRSEAADLAMAAGESVDQQAAERIADQAGGNPFFIVEITGMLLDRALAQTDGLPLPPTVQAVMASRIDHLPAEARELVRLASVFPDQTFPISKLRYIADPREEIIGLLDEAEILFRDAARPDWLRFRHEMVRDVAYQTLAKRERMRLHQQVADGIIAAGAEERHHHMVAYHLEQAARASLDLDSTDRSLAQRAVESLSHAADHARRRLESRTAIDLYERALRLSRPEKDWMSDEAGILSGIGEARYWLGEFDRAEADLTRALDFPELGPRVESHAARFLADIILNVRGEPLRAEPLFERALAAAREHGDPWATARTLLMAGWVPIWKDGDYDTARFMFEEALAIARNNPSKDVWAEARALTSLASAISPVGEESECLKLAEEALALGTEVGDPFTVAVAHQYLGNSLRRMGKLDEALPHFNESVKVFRDLDARWEIASAVGDRGTVHRIAGRLGQAETDLREALALCRELNERVLVTWTASELARILLAQGEIEAARTALTEPAARLAAEADPQALASLLAAESLLALAEGDKDQARERAVAALEAARPQSRNELASWIWWVGSLFGAEAVGGENRIEWARQTLESAGWTQHLREPEWALASVSAPG